MYSVGIDIAKEKHDCAIIDSVGNVLDSFTFGNDKIEFNAFSNSISWFLPLGIIIGFVSTGLIAMRDSVFKEYMKKKLSEGKHYNIAKSHVAKKLVRVVFKLLSTETKFNR